MSGYHAVAVEGRVDAVELIGAVYGMAAHDPVAVDGEDGFPWGLDEDRAAAAHVGGWTVLCGSLAPDLFSDDEAAHFAALSRGGRLFRWVVERTVGGVGFDYLVDGKVVRSFFQAEGEVEHSVGAPLEGEPEGGFEAAGPFETGEWEIVEVMSRHVLPWEQLSEAQYQMYTLR